MRRILLCSALALLLVVSNLSPRPVGAEEEQAPAPWYLELLRPREASSKIQETMKEFPRRQQRLAMQRMATEYLDAWKRSGLEHGEHELDALYSLNFSAQRYGNALALMLPRVHDEALALNLRAAAAGRVASVLRNYRMAESLGEEVETEAVAAVQAILPLLEVEEHAATRGTLHTALAAHAARQEDEEAQIRHLLLAAEATPTSAGSAARTIVRLLQGKAHDMVGYEAVRKRADEVLPKLKAIAAAFLEKAKAAGDEGQTKRGEALVDQLEKVDRPLQMLGEPVSAWTLEHAFGDVQALAELEGKVVVLDFWATWCKPCVMALPLVAEVAKEMADSGVVFYAVNQRQSPSLIESFLDQQSLDIPVALDKNGSTGRAFGVGSIPHSVIIDKKGIVRKVHVGFGPGMGKMLKAEIEELLAE